MKIKILAVSPAQSIQKGKNTYFQRDITFKKLDDGKVGSRGLISFKYPELWEFFAKVEPNAEVDVKVEKQGEYWNWIGASALEAGQEAVDAAPQETGTTVAHTWPAKPTSNYETREERAFRQLLIVRQSSVNAAVSLLKTEKSVPALEDILAVATQIEKHVFNTTLEPQPEIN